MALPDLGISGGARENQFKEQLPLSGKIALVTGSSRGIGKAIAIELARRGAMPIIHFNTKERRARETADEISRLGTLQQIPPWFSADITVAEQVDGLYTQIKNHPLLGGVIDILVLNAAGGLERDRDPDYPERVNVWAQVNLVRRALDLNLLRSGGDVIYITSHVAKAWGEDVELISPDPDMKNYLEWYKRVAQSKHQGEEELLKMEGELRSHGISIAVVTAPLVDDTPAILFLRREGLLEKAKDTFGSAKPEDVATSLVDYLCYPESRTGNPLIIDGESYEKTFRLVRSD